MKSSFLFFLMCCCIPFVSPAQNFPPLDKSPHDIVYYRGKDKAPIVKINYGRPQRKGREVFGELEPYGKVWRTGADEATEIKFYKDVKIGGKDVKAGTYSLFSIPEKEKWTIILNSELDTWGAFTYNQQKDVLRLEVKPQVLNIPLEVFSIIVQEADQGAKITLAWDKVLVDVPFAVLK